MSFYEDAVLSSKIIEFVYHGSHRTVEPHAYGISRLGHRVLRCFQISGGSRSGEPIGWKIMLETEIYSAQSTEQTFQSPRDRYKRGDKGMKTILAQL